MPMIVNIGQSIPNQTSDERSKPIKNPLIEVKCWHECRGNVVLAIHPTFGLVAHIFRENQCFKVSQEWIKGIPSNIQHHPKLLRQYLKETYIRVATLQGGDFKIYINQRIKGGTFDQLNAKLRQQIKDRIVALIKEKKEAGEELEFKVDYHESIMIDVEISYDSAEDNQIREQALDTQKELLNTYIAHVWNKELKQETSPQNVEEMRTPPSQPESPPPSAEGSVLKETTIQPQPDDHSVRASSPGGSPKPHQAFSMEKEEEIEANYQVLANRTPQISLQALNNFDTILNANYLEEFSRQSGQIIGASLDSQGHSTNAVIITNERVGGVKEPLRQLTCSVKTYTKTSTSAIQSNIRHQEKLQEEQFKFLREIRQAIVRGEDVDTTSITAFQDATVSTSRGIHESTRINLLQAAEVLDTGFAKAVEAYKVVATACRDAISEVRKQNELDLKNYREREEILLESVKNKTEIWINSLRAITDTQLSLANQTTKNYIARNQADLETQLKLEDSKVQHELQLMEEKRKVYEIQYEQEMKKIVLVSKEKVDLMAKELENHLQTINKEIESKKELHILELQKFHIEDERRKAEQLHETEMAQLKNQQEMHEQQFKIQVERENQKFQAEQEKLKRQHEKDKLELQKEQTAETNRAKERENKNATLQTEYEGMLKLYNRQLDELEKAQTATNNSWFGKLIIHENEPPRIEDGRVIRGKLKYTIK